MKTRLKRTISGLLAIALLSCPAFALSFPDVNEYDDYVEAIYYVSEAGLMVGDDLGNFNPYKTVTRAEMATIICRMLGETEELTRTGKFSDLPFNHWANPYISRANEMGIIGGYGDGRVGPSDSLTYEQAVTMVVRALGGEREAQNAGGYPNGYLASAKGVGLLQNIDEQVGAPMSRTDVAMLLYNAMN